MSKAKKAIDEARDSQNRELDLVDKNVSSFDEMSGLRKCLRICSIVFLKLKYCLPNQPNFENNFTCCVWQQQQHPHKNLRNIFIVNIVIVLP